MGSSEVEGEEGLKGTRERFSDEVELDGRGKDETHENDMMIWSRFNLEEHSLTLCDSRLPVGVFEGVLEDKGEGREKKEGREKGELTSISRSSVPRERTLETHHNTV